MRRTLRFLLAAVLLQASAHGASAAARRMVVAPLPEAAEAGLQMLRDGGGAVDAAVAAAMVLAVLSPQTAGPGGGGFLVRADPAGVVETWDGRETAPAAARPDLLLDRDGTPVARAEAATGGRAVGVPGLLRMLAAAHAAHGRLPWAALLRPAIRLAAEGTALPAPLAQAIDAEAARLRTMPSAAALFLHADGSAREAGEVWKNPALADTLRVIATEGAPALYRGPIAADVAAAVRADPRPGLLTADDLAAYQEEQRPPVCAAHRGGRVCGMGPPSLGGIAVAALLAAGPDAGAASERRAEADARAHVADPDFLDVPVAAMTAPGRFAATADLAVPERARETASQVSVVGDDGEAVALTVTLQSPFGAALAVRGFPLNDSLLGFDARPTTADGRPVADSVEAAKRPASDMAPTIALDVAGAVVAVVGATGDEWMPAQAARILADLFAGRTATLAPGTQILFRAPDGLHAATSPEMAVAAE